MSTPNWDTLTILGVGLLGGSIGLAARRRQVARRVIGWGRRPAPLDAALALGALDEIRLDLTAAVREADLVIVCTPVELVADLVCRTLAEAPHALVTDVGSTKAGIVDAVRRELRRTGREDSAERFVAGHPLAGGERGGVENSRHDLFEGKTVVVTPTGAEQPGASGAVSDFWRALGAKVVEQTPDDHDRTVAAISHLPHLAASALAAATPAEALPFVASGWLDTTRVAAGDVELWRQIFAANRRHVGAALDDLLRVLEACREALRGDDDRVLVECLQAGKRNRDAVGN